MLKIAVRILIGLALVGLAMGAIDWLFGTDVLGAIWRLILWFSRQIVEFVVRFAVSAASVLRSVAQRTLWRKMMKPLWRFALLSIMLHFLGKVRTVLIEQWFGVQKSRSLEAVKRIIRTRPDWPRSAYMLIAVSAIAFSVWGWIWISDNIGFWWGTAASILFGMMVEYVRILGFDVLTSWLAEKWAPAKAFLDQRPWIRWLWLGPLFAWLFDKIESRKEKHGARHGGKGALDRWAEKRRARKARRMRGAEA